MFARLLGTVLFLLHAAAVVASLAGPVFVLLSTFHEGPRITVAPWRNVFGDLSRWGTLLGNTGAVAGIAVPLCMAAGIVLGVTLFRTDILCRRVWIAVMLFTATIPLYVVSASIIAMAGLERWLGSRLMVALIHAAAYVPIVSLIIGVAVRSVRADLEEAALAEGAAPVRTLCHVTLPMAAGGLAASVVLAVLWITTDYSVSDVLLVRTFAEEVYTQYQLRGRLQEPALVCVPQILLFAALLWSLRKGFLSGEAAKGDPPADGSPHRFRTGRWRWPATVAAGAVVLALALGPAVFLGCRLSRAHDGMTLLLSFAPEIRTSLATSLAAAVLTAGLAVGLAWFLVCRRRWRSVLTAYVVLMLAFPAPILGMGLIRIFNRPGVPGWVYDSPLILVLVYTIRFLPVAVVLLIPAIRAVPRECELAAKVDGCGAVGTWWYLIWPLCLPAALVAMFAVFILAIGELPCSLLVTPPGYVTVGARFFSLIHYGLYPDAAALCLISMVAVLAPWGGLVWLLRKRLLS
ncbi:MAG: ABC transporter permease [Phycisphaerae bacterium]